MQEYMIDDYIHAFWHNSGAVNLYSFTSRQYPVFRDVLHLFLEYGTCGKDYNDLCGYFSSAHKIPIPEIQGFFKAYKRFFNTRGDAAIVKYALGNQVFSSDQLSAYEILQYSSGYIKRIMRQSNYKNNDNKRYISVAFTGPRPEKLPPNLDAGILKNAITEKTEQAILDGFAIFYTGMSRGVDMTAADCVLSLKGRYPDIKLVCAVPFPEQADKWNKRDKARYDELLNRADHVEVVSQSHVPRAYHKRNEFMVDNSERLIAVYDDMSGGGTEYTVNYANKMGVDVVVIDPLEILRFSLLPF